ncbi:hypothetical protein L1887_22061 [Cichorium endivia]|nr:hypothetical protein L1887_22061 [Cichorium endivia]
MQNEVQMVNDDAGMDLELMVVEVSMESNGDRGLQEGFAFPIFTSSLEVKEGVGSELLSSNDKTILGKVSMKMSNFMLVWLPAPTVSLRSPVAVSVEIVAKFFSRCPNNAFQVSSDFVGAATSGAIGVISRCIPPINPTDPECFHIVKLEFLREDFGQTTENGAVESGSDEASEAQLEESKQDTSASLNNDLKGTKAYQEADVLGLYNLAMAIRVLSGILQGDKSNSLLYGFVDIGKKIYWNQDFHSKMSYTSHQIAAPMALLEVMTVVSSTLMRWVSARNSNVLSLVHLPQIYHRS